MTIRHFPNVEVIINHFRLKIFREHLGMTQSQLAEESGIKKNTITTYEIGRSEPSTEYIAYLHSKGMNLNWLWTGEGEMISKKAEKNLTTQTTGTDEEASGDEKIRALEAEFLSLLSGLTGEEALKFSQDERLKLLRLLTKDAEIQR